MKQTFTKQNLTFKAVLFNRENFKINVSLSYFIFPDMCSLSSTEQKTEEIFFSNEAINNYFN